MTLRALAAVLLALATAAPAAAAETRTIYSSLPLTGPYRETTRDVVRGIRLALDQRGGRAGTFDIRYVSLDDAVRGSWDPPRVDANARRAAADATAVGYIGEFNSGASAVSMPRLNRAGIAQVSPSNTYVGLTRREAAVRGEPKAYHPTGRRTYVRVVPADHLQADALVEWMAAEGVRRLSVADDGEVYGDGMRAMVARRARAAGIRVLDAGRVRHGGSRVRGASLRAIARRVDRQRADGFFFGGVTRNGAPRLYTDVRRASPETVLFGADGVADPGFTDGVPATVQRRLRITLVTPDAALAQPFTEAFEQRHGSTPGTYAVYGYESMLLLLDAVAAGAGTRAGTVDALFAVRDRESVLGSYSIDANGDTTNGRYGGYRVRGGALRLSRMLGAGPRALGAGSRTLGAGSRTLGAGSRTLGAGG